ncbi:hypothetical protein ABFT80_20790 [Mesorhizobium sp. SB112]|uniref:hypothetical protein n=1 Tax=Mesorhizobium sp. SB112 TaxID=3151853 RepID=UPI003263D28C
MSSSDFRQIALKGEAGKAERLFRAAVSAFCSLPRPSKQEISKLEDLTLPLFDQVSQESLRFVSAALSECETAPHSLVLRLCSEPVDIAAPLLIRSNALREIDLITLIATHGLPHAKAISRRLNLNPSIAHLATALQRATGLNDALDEDDADADPDAIEEPQSPVPGAMAEEVRARLRDMMRPAKTAPPRLDRDAYVNLRETSLKGNATFVEIALAEALDLDLERARLIVEATGYSSLLTALRALDLSEEEAFLITMAIFPAHFPNREAISLFLGRFRLLRQESAQDRVRSWKGESDKPGSKQFRAS